MTGGQVGDVPAEDPAQVQSAIDEIGAVRFGLTSALWHHIMPDLTEMISSGTYLPYCASLDAGRWRQAAGLAQVEATFATGAEDAAAAKVEKWLALDMGHGPETIRADHLPGPVVLQHPRRQLVNGMGRGPRAALIGPVIPQRPRTLLPRRVLCEF
jgi:hypothetical protein